MMQVTGIETHAVPIIFISGAILHLVDPKSFPSIQSFVAT